MPLKKISNIVVLPICMALCVSCASTYERESPYPRSKWSKPLSYLGDRVRNLKHVTLHMVRDRLGNETVLQDIGYGRKRGWWYLKHEKIGLTSLVQAEFSNSDYVTTAEISEFLPQVKKSQFRELAERLVARVQGGEQTPVDTIRMALGVEAMGELTTEGSMKLMWPLYPGFLVATTDLRGNRLHSLKIDDTADTMD